MILGASKRIVTILSIVALISLLYPIKANASAGSESITIFAPNSSVWLSKTAEAFTEKTGINVKIETADLRYEDYCAALSELMRNSNYDVLLSEVQPAETSYHYKNLVDLREIIKKDANFNLDDYFTNVIESYSDFDGDALYTMPISFDLSLHAASKSAAEHLGCDLPETIPSRQAFIDICRGMPISDEVYILSDSDQLIDYSGTVPTTGWIASDFMLEALALIKVDKSPRFSDENRWKALCSDYFDYYSQSFSYSGEQNQDNQETNYELLTNGKLLFSRVEFDEAFNLGLTGDFMLYEFPYSAAGQTGIYHSVKGLSIVKNGNEASAWEFIKYVMSYDVQRKLTGCPILYQAAKERAENIRVGNSSLLALTENCGTPSYIGLSGGGYLQSNVRFTYMWDASHIVKYALSGIMDHYNMDASELLFNAQAKILEHFCGISPYVRNTVFFIMYIIPLLLIVAAVILFSTVASRSREYKKLKGFVSDKPRERILGHKNLLRWLGLLCFASVLAFAAVCFALNEKAALFYPITSAAAAMLMLALGIFLLFCGKYYEILIYDGQYLIFQGYKGYFLTRKDITNVEWSYSVNGCRLTINGPRIIYLKYAQYRELDKLKTYISTNNAVKEP